VKPKTALLIRLSALGDIVLATAAIELLHRHGVRLFFVAKSQYIDLFKCDHRLERVIPLDSTRLSELRRIAKELGGQRFDAVFDLHFKIPTILLTIFVRGDRKFFYNKRIFARRWAVLTHTRPKEVHTVELYLRPIRKFLGLRDHEMAMPRLVPCSCELPDLPTPYGVIAPGANAPQRVWPHFPDFCRKAAAQFQIKMVVVGVEGDAFAHAVARECGAVDMVGKTDIQGLMALLSNAEFVVSNDSAPMHIASALGVPTVAIFGPTVPEFGMRPLGLLSKVVEPKDELPCRPCSLHGEKRCRYGGRPRCLESIEVDDVMAALDEIVRKKESLRWH